MAPTTHFTFPDFVPIDPYEPYDIYILIDPRHNTIHYVGISTNSSTRYKQHLKSKYCNPHRLAWIRELQAMGLQPQLQIIEQAKGKTAAKERERYWMNVFGKQGSPLTNIHGNLYEIPKSREVML